MQRKESTNLGSALVLNNLADEELIGVRAVAVGGVEEGDAGGHGVANERDHVRLRLGRAVVGGHAHAAEALRPCEPSFMRGTTMGDAAMLSVALEHLSVLF